MTYITESLAISSVADPVPGSSGITLNVLGGEGNDRFPDPASYGSYYLVVEPEEGTATPENTEVVSAVARVGDSFAIVRSQFGSAARDIQPGDHISMLPKGFPGSYPITAPDIAADAVTSAKIANNTIVDGDISPSAAIQVAKLAPGSSGQYLTTTGGVVAWGAAPGGSYPGTYPIVNADVAAAAAIGWTKVSKAGSSLADLAARPVSALAPGTNGDVLTTVAGVAAWSASAGGNPFSTDVTARSTLSTQTKIGAVGPAGEAGISFGSAADTSMYRPSANLLRTNSTLSAGKGISNTGYGHTVAGTFDGTPALIADNASAAGQTQLVFRTAAGDRAMIDADYLGNLSFDTIDATAALYFGYLGVAGHNFYTSPARLPMTIQPNLVTVDADLTVTGKVRGGQSVYSFDVVAGYGADPTGSADSTTPIRNALAAAALLPGSVVYFRAGTYRITGTIIVPPGVHLKGEGAPAPTMGAAVTFTGTANPMFRWTGLSTDFMGKNDIENLSFRPDGSCTIIRWDGCQTTYVNFINCNFVRVAGTVDAFYATAMVGGGFERNMFYRCRWEHCRFAIKVDAAGTGSFWDKTLVEKCVIDYAGNGQTYANSRGAPYYDAAIDINVRIHRILEFRDIVIEAQQGSTYSQGGIFLAGAGRVEINNLYTENMCMRAANTYDEIFFAKHTSAEGTAYCEGSKIVNFFIGGGGANSRYAINYAEVGGTFQNDVQQPVSHALEIGAAYSVSGPSGGNGLVLRPTDTTIGVRAVATNLHFSPAETWVAPALGTGWANEVGTAGFRKHPDGTVEIKGRISHTGAANGAANLTIPAGFRPTAQFSMPVMTTISGGAAYAPAELVMNSDGSTNLYGLGTMTRLYLNGLRYYPSR